MLRLCRIHRSSCLDDAHGVVYSDLLGNALYIIYIIHAPDDRHLQLLCATSHSPDYVVSGLAR
jgi:hypothetical protein